MRQSGAPLGELYSALAGAEMEGGDAVLTTPPLAMLQHEPITAIKIGYSPAAGVFGSPSQIARNSFSSSFQKQYAAAAALENTDLFFLGAGLWDVEFHLPHVQSLGVNSAAGTINLAIGPSFTQFASWWQSGFYTGAAGTSEWRMESIGPRRICLARSDEPLRFRLAVDNSVGTTIFAVMFSWYCKKLR